MLRLAPRDLAILRALQRYRCLPSTYLHGLVGGSRTTLKWRLRELFDAGLVLRPSFQWSVAQALSMPTIYELSALGAGRLRDFGLPAPEAGVALGKADGHHWHTLLVSELMASIEIAVGRVPGCALIAEDDILARLALARVSHLSPRALPVGDDRYIVPDGLFGIRAPAGVVLYALEADRGHEPLARRGAGSSYRHKIELYDRLLAGGMHRRLLGTAAPLAVLHVTTNAARLRAVMRLPALPAVHLFRAVEPRFGGHAEPIASMVEEPWQRADGSRFSLATGSPAPEQASAP